MAGPVAAFIQLPVDTGNTGKKVRTQSRVVGADTVHEHFFIEGRARELLGVYRLALAQQTIVAAAQNGTSTGFCWAHVPTAITNKWARLRRIYISSQHSTALATPTAPRIVVSRMTFTGAATGASAGTPVMTTSGVPAAVLDLRTAPTGLTVTLVGLAAAGAITGALTAVGAYGVVDQNILDPGESEDEWFILKPGEGVVMWQDTPGTTADTRKFNPVFVWDEVDVA